MRTGGQDDNCRGSAWIILHNYEDAEKKRQTRKVFFSTDTSMSARDIFDIYRTRFQLEFVFYDKHIIMQSKSDCYIIKMLVS